MELNHPFRGAAAFIDYLAKKHGISAEDMRAELRSYLDEYGKANG